MKTLISVPLGDFLSFFRAVPHTQFWGVPTCSVWVDAAHTQLSVYVKRFRVLHCMAFSDPVMVYCFHVMFGTWGTFSTLLVPICDTLCPSVTYRQHCWVQEGLRDDFRDLCKLADVASILPGYIRDLG